MDPSDQPPEPQPDRPAGRGEENPYAVPLEGKWIEETARGTIAGSELRAPVAPWSGGWGLMTLVLGLICGVGVALAIESESAAIGGLLLPVLGLALIAVLVRFLHSSVDVEWPIYLLISAAFGVVAYVAFIPVCLVVAIPVAIVLEQVEARGTIGATVVFFAVVFGCTLIFTGLLRLYLKHRYRKQWFAELAASSPPPASEQIGPGDPFATPRDRTP